MACCLGGKQELPQWDTPLDYAIQAQFPGQTREDLLRKLPSFTVVPLSDDRPLFVGDGPQVNGDDQEKSKLYSLGDTIAMKSVSTYPVKKLPDQNNNSSLVREGDPNADHFALEAFPNRIVTAIADGCGWGTGPHLASTNATKKFVEYFRENHLLIKSVKDVGTYLLNAANAANDEVARQQEEHPGTTTILGGVLCQVNKAPHNMRWLFAFVNIGDCKAFKWSAQSNTITDLTAGNRSAFAATDPGGRLGPGDSLDVRNIAISYAECDEGDIVFLVSDGVHDNGPPSQGITPNELDQSLPSEWKDLPADKIQALTSNWLLDIITTHQTHQGAITPSLITNKLVEYSVNTTKPSREFLEDAANEHKRLPADPKQFPGKMDHCSCVAFRVGPVSA